MTTNVQGTRPTVRPDEQVGVEPKPTTTPVVNPSGVNGVAVYDRGPNGTTTPSVLPSVSMHEDPAPVTTQSTGTIIAWIIGIVVLLVLVYFLWQMFL
jgi:hypothetical protein